MHENYCLVNRLAGTVHIDHATGALSWDQENLDPLIKKFVKRYLIDEGFIEQALDMLDPVIDPEINAQLKSLLNSSL